MNPDSSIMITKALLKVLWMAMLRLFILKMKSVLLFTIFSTKNFASDYAFGLYDKDKELVKAWYTD